MPRKNQIIQMKILFDHSLPFALAHGGFQVQIEQTMAALERNGAKVEHVRWWDERQRGDLIHFFGRPSEDYVGLAQARGMKVVVAELHSGLGSRSAGARLAQKTIMRAAQALLPKTFTARLAWGTYRQADAFIAGTAWEASLIETMFDADPRKIHVVVNGVEGIFARPHVGGTHLVCTSAIHPRKRVAELAAAAARARVPVWIVGKPYTEADSYYQKFLALHRDHPEWIRYEGAIADREKLAEIYAGARGFVLLSTQESLSLSSFEAAAAGCPLLLSDLPWARSAFGDMARYISPRLKEDRLAVVLRQFHDEAPSLTCDFRPPSWDEIGASLMTIYGKLIRP
jgi:glycosyltransferase involved in cell wall biosynthesis